MLQIASCAGAAIMDSLHALVATLLDNFRGEIDLVMRRTNAGTELNDKIGRTRTKLNGHSFDPDWDDTKFGAFFSRMHETNHAPNRVD